MFVEDIVDGWCLVFFLAVRYSSRMSFLVGQCSRIYCFCRGNTGYSYGDLAFGEIFFVVINVQFLMFYR